MWTNLLVISLYLYTLDPQSKPQNFISEQYCDYFPYKITDNMLYLFFAQWAFHIYCLEKYLRGLEYCLERKGQRGKKIKTEKKFETFYRKDKKAMNRLYLYLMAWTCTIKFAAIALCVLCHNIAIWFLRIGLSDDLRKISKAK